MTVPVPGAQATSGPPAAVARAATPGIFLAGGIALIMPWLAVAKRRTGRALGNRTLIAGSAETAFCAATLLGWVTRRLAPAAERACNRTGRRPARPGVRCPVKA